MAKKKAVKKAKKTVTKKKVDKNPKGTLVNGDFAITLVEADYVALGKSAAKKNLFKKELVEEKKIYNKDKQDKINGLNSEIEEISTAIKEGKRTRRVQATMVKDFDKGTIEYYFDGEIVESKNMTEADRQEQFDLEERKIKKEAKTARTNAAKKRSKKNNVIDLNPGQSDVADVIALETNKKTKKSAVDGNITI